MYQCVWKTQPPFLSGTQRILHYHKRPVGAVWPKAAALKDVKYSKLQNDFCALVHLYLVNEQFLGKKVTKGENKLCYFIIPLCPLFVAYDKWKDSPQDTQSYLVWEVWFRSDGRVVMDTEKVPELGDLFPGFKSPWGSTRRKDRDPWLWWRSWLAFSWILACVPSMTMTWLRQVLGCAFAGRRQWADPAEKGPAGGDEGPEQKQAAFTVETSTPRVAPCGSLHGNSNTVEHGQTLSVIRILEITKFWCFIV